MKVIDLSERQRQILTYMDAGVEYSTEQVAEIKLYDKERCLCDLIRNKEQMDMQLYTQAIKDYFKANPNNRKLLKYGKLFGIEDKIRTYIEVL